MTQDTHTEPRYWIAEPSNEDVWADPRAADSWRIVDEEAGGAIAYFDTLEGAEIMLRKLTQ